jgi:PHP family Zn ribbon phosphoesterase
MPINIMGDWARPDYREEVGSRKRKCEEARTTTNKAVADIERWKRMACEEITHMITDLTSLKDKIDQELNELQREITAAIDVGLQEAQKSLFLLQPALQSPFGKALFASLPGAVQFISLQTDFASWKSAFERAIFSMDLCFQLELPGFEPTAT